jgi:DNA-binding XRE family transcriptional regulator
MAGDPHPAPAKGGTRRRGRPGARDVDLAVARRIRRRRLELGLTQQDVAERLGLTSQQMHKHETGAIRISAGRLHQLAELLGMEIGHFFADVDPAGPNRARRGGTCGRASGAGSWSSCAMSPPSATAGTGRRSARWRGHSPRLGERPARAAGRSVAT